MDICTRKQNKMKVKKRQLLIVEDSALIVKRLLSTLEEDLSNTEISAVLNGTDALAAIHDIKPEVVLLDIHLPDISGIDVLKTIRHAYPDTSVIMLSNHSATHTRTTCMNAGASAFYDKSKEFQLAIEHVKNLEL
mgnify:CR=1 FL=1